MKLTTRREIIKCALGAAAGLAPFFSNSIFAFGSGTASSRYKPRYLQLHRSGELKRRGEALWALMESCELCPRMCDVV